MRISDWSSDVCSSDLQELADHIPAVCGMTIRDRADMVYIEHAVGHRAASVNSGLGARIPIGNTASGRAYAAALSAADREQILAAQIGRASCRERVCQYV